METVSLQSSDGKCDLNLKCMYSHKLPKLENEIFQLNKIKFLKNLKNK